MLTAIRARLHDDAGIGIILVLGITVFVAGLTVTAATIAQNGLGQSRQRINFERSMAAAESGIDYALGHLQYAFDEAAADYPIPAKNLAPSSACPVVEIELPDLKNVNEKQWAKAQLKMLVEQHPECLIDTPDGQVMVLKPKNRAGGAGIQYGRVYAMGWSPAYGDPRASARTVKAEYVFMPYRPKHAILTGQSLTLNSTSTDVMGAHGVNPKEASVHTNGDLTVIGQPTVTGPVSYSGSATGNFTNFKDDTATKKKDFRIPKVSAVGFYNKAPKVDEAAMQTWTDLCPNGEAKLHSGKPTTLGDPWIPNSIPCTGAKLGDSPYNGWSFNSGTRTWTASKDTASGTYFVHQADVANGTGNGSIPNITVIASAEGTGCTGKQYGNIVWDHYDTPAPAFTNLFFMADGDLDATSNFYSGQSAPGNVVSGMYVAGEEIRVFTSSSGLVGAVLAANQCSSDTGPVASNEVQGQIVKFDPKSESPFSSLISTTLWLEYVG